MRRAQPRARPARGGAGPRLPRVERDQRRSVRTRPARRACCAAGPSVVLAPQADDRRGPSRCTAAASASTTPCAACCRERPTISAGARTWTWQIVFAAGALGATIGGVFVVPDATIAALTGLIALPFLCVTLLRLVALRQILADRRRGRAQVPHRTCRASAMHSLPVYSVLVPLLREGNVLDRAGAFAARPRLSRRPSSTSCWCSRPDDTGDPGGVAAHRPAGQLSHHHRAGAAAADQAQGLELRAAVRTRRVRGGVRRRGPAGARPAAQRAGGVSRRRTRSRVRAGPAQHLQSVAQLADAAVHHRILRAVRRHPAGAGAAAPAGAAGRHVEPLSARGAGGGRRLGPVQRHRGRRPRHPPGAPAPAHVGPGLRPPGRRRPSISRPG